MPREEWERERATVTADGAADLRIGPDVPPAHGVVHERHLLVTLSKESGVPPAGRRYLCDEQCLRRWLDAE